MRFPQATGNAAADEGYHQLYDYLKRAWDDSVTELAVDYVSLGGAQGHALHELQLQGNMVLGLVPVAALQLVLAQGGEHLGTGPGRPG